ncbi:hypothetical protein L6R49_12355 [Myxococcota bacterium]|nr:hypothetical protein [Myxococcota bacterium]
MADDAFTASPSYAAGQQLRALHTLQSHPSAAVRERAVAKLQRWQAVLDGMTSGTLSIGDRAPVADTPVWATLEVAHGGFATGRLLAESPLDEAETALLATLPPDAPGTTPRGKLNHHALSGPGQATILARVLDGRYRVEVPEEGALAVVAWLMHRGTVDRALGVVEAIAPFFERLRFTPRETDIALSAGLSVFREPVGAVRDALERHGGSKRVAVMNETLRVWNPLTDRAVSLLLETVDGEPPGLATDAAGQLLRGPKGQPVVTGGAPLVHIDDGWRARARAFVDDLNEATRRHRRAKGPRAERSTLAVLSAAIRRALGDKTATPKADVRAVLAGAVARRGAPGSDIHTILREEQAAIAARPSNKELAELLANRLKAYRPEGGLPSLEEVSGPAREDELPQAPGLQLPASLLEKLGRCLEAPIEELMALGVVPSAEVLAELLPQITAQTVSAGVDDPALRRLFVSIYGAFRRRRTLLLLNLQSQVRIDELPWVAALSTFRRPNLSGDARARQTLEQVSALAFTGFPQTILPNPLISEMATLSEAAGLKLPLVEELAADIFMGAFTPKFERAAVVASTLLAGRLYARYYDLPAASVYPPPETPREKRWGKATAESFAALCQERAKPAEGVKARGFSVAANGVVLEQAQILHTHNLAVLFQALGLGKTLADRLVPMAKDCFLWILRRNAQPAVDWKVELQLIKNCAYAWRQMVFFLSLAEPDEVSAFLAWARETFTRHAAEARVARLEPALLGLEAIHGGARFDAAGKTPGGGRRLLGWTLGPHWLKGS